MKCIEFVMRVVINYEMECFESISYACKLFAKKPMITRAFSRNMVIAVFCMYWNFFQSKMATRKLILIYSGFLQHHETLSICKIMCNIVSFLCDTRFIGSRLAAVKSEFSI